MKKLSVFLGIVIASLVWGVGASHVVRGDEMPPLRVFYFVPADCEMCPDAPQRLGRTMKHVQDFYRNGMVQNGLPNTVFSLEWESEDALKLHVVRGKENQSAYGRNDAWKVYEEIKVAALEEGLDPQKEVFLVFEQLLKWEGDRTVELGPYCGWGTTRNGVAWVFDDPLLDAANLGSTAPGGYYNGKCSVGQFNSHYVGGIAHELGHAFGLPHDCETSAQRRALGSSLMGSGNHTYGQELRGEGRGTFLTMASALRLSVNRLFNANYEEDLKFELNQITAPVLHSVHVEQEKNVLRVTGQVTHPETIPGVIVYFDKTDIPADYDAKTWTQPLAADGSFDILLDELEVKAYQLRIYLPLRSGPWIIRKIDVNITDWESE